MNHIPIQACSNLVVPTDTMQRRWSSKTLDCSCYSFQILQTSMNRPHKSSSTSFRSRKSPRDTPCTTWLPLEHTCRSRSPCSLSPTLSSKTRPSTRNTDPD
jgi:hypothetical protein